VRGAYNMPRPSTGDRSVTLESAATPHPRRLDGKAIERAEKDAPKIQCGEEPSLSAHGSVRDIHYLKLNTIRMQPFRKLCARPPPQIADISKRILPLIPVSQ
jgi:hypothetical protein